MKEQRVIYLDAVRGIAAIIVALDHYLLVFYPTLMTFDLKQSHTVDNLEISIGLTPLNIFYNGSFAVCVFFVLSGYVLSLLFFRDNYKEGIYSAAFKRYFRLGIPVFFSVLISFLLLKSNAYHDFEAAHEVNAGYYFSALLKTQPGFSNMLYEGIYRMMFIRAGSNYNVVLWTMNIEFFGSLMVFSFLILFGNLRNRWVIYIILLFVFKDSYYLAFFLGIMLCDYCNSAHVIKVHWTINLMIVFIALYISTYQLYGKQNIWSPLDGLFPQTKQTLYIIGAFLFLFVVLNSPRIKIIFSKEIFHYLGNISFSIYLLHVLVFCSISCYLFELFKNELLWNYHVSVVVTLLISIGIVWAASHLFYKLIDKNGMRFSGYLYRKFFRRKDNVSIYE